MRHNRGEITLDELRQLRLIESLKHFKKNITAKETHEYFLAFFDIIIEHIKPENAIYVEDSWENDVTGSLNAGMKPIWFNGDKK